MRANRAAGPGRQRAEPRALNEETAIKAVLCKAFTGVDDLVFAEIDPPTLGEGEIRVAMRAAALNFMDILVVQGRYQLKPPLPFAAGSDGAGEVREVGPGVTRFKPGDRVGVGAFFGAFAQEMVVPAAHAFPIPDGVDYPQAAAYRSSYGTSHYALVDRGRLQAGETLLVHGAAGGLGLSAVELGVLLGARVIGTVGSEEKMAIVREYGAEHVIDYSSENFRERVKELTDGKGADVIYDVVGGDVFDQSLRCINWGGRLLVIGFTSGRIPSAPANLPLLKSCSIVGVFYGAWILRDPEAAAAMHATLLGWLEQKRLRPHICKTLPLEKAAEGLNLLVQRKATGKVVLEIP